eukprot:766347-Hanusia_phi.AAC.1
MAEQWRAAAVAMAALALSVALLLVTMKDNEANSGSRSVLYVLGGDAMVMARLSLAIVANSVPAEAISECRAGVLCEYPDFSKLKLTCCLAILLSPGAESTSGDVSEQSKWAIRYLQTGKLFHGEKSGHPASGVDCYYKHPASYCAQKEQSLKGSGSSSNSRPSVFVVSLPHLFDVRQVGSTYDADCFFYHSVDHCMRLRAEQSKARQQSLGHGGAKQTKSKEAEVASKPQIYTPASPPHLSHSTADVHMKEARIKMEEEKAEDKVKQAKVPHEQALIGAMLMLHVEMQEELHKLATAKRSSHLKELHKSERITLKKWKHDAEQSNDPVIFVVKWYLEHGIKPIDALRGSRASTMSLSMKPKGREHQQSPSAQKHLADFQVSKQNLMEGSGTSSSSSERANKKELSIKALETEAQMDGLALIPIKCVQNNSKRMVD